MDNKNLFTMPVVNSFSEINKNSLNINGVVNKKIHNGYLPIRDALADTSDTLDRTHFRYFQPMDMKSSYCKQATGHWFHLNATCEKNKQFTDLIIFFKNMFVRQLRKFFINTNFLSI